MQQPEVVIRGADGKEHVFPPGFDPKKAAEIVRSRATTAKPAEMPVKPFGQQILDPALGVVKGAANTAIGLGEAFYNYVPGVKPLSDAISGGPGEASFGAARREIQPTNTAQSLGYGAEQIAEYFVPGVQAEKLAATVASKLPKYLRLLPNMAAQSATGAGVASVQGGDPTTAAVTGAAVPAVVGAAGAPVRWAANQAAPLVRAAIKPTVTAMKRVAGASVEGLDAKAEQLVRFIIENRVTTAAKARGIFDAAEVELRALLQNKKASTDAAQRASRYLSALERSAKKQGLGADDVATIRNAAAELLDGPMGEDVVSMVPVAHPTLVDASGKQVTVLTPKVTRQLRASVPAEESLESARSSGQWNTRKQWGEQKGAQIEAKKTVERAQRDAVKAAVPEAKPLLKRESMAQQAEEVLDRMAFRAANRDAVSLPAHVVAAGEIASGRVPLLAFAANWLRNNQLKAGIWADDLKKAIDSGNAQKAKALLNRLGVGTAGVATQTGGTR